MAYYYLIAALPALELGTAPELDGDALRARGAEALRKSEQAVLGALLSDRPAGESGFPARWHAVNTQIRNAIARERAGRRGVDPTAGQRAYTGFDVSAERAVSDAYGRANPLERERALDQFRWNLAGELAGHEAFAVEAVYAYAVRLRIAERWAAWDASAGSKRLNAIVGKLGQWSESPAI